ncbi:putative serine/arginine repetitive matrix protein 1 [Cocos nucifera]|uniref:Putative serine/arginine repetitive matrix protein 1 n=1 Tax=Cocos nucifera TaxID=13894 RepID=A0A8K0IG02_COCNU|nr:putative serine/arginine repetitive matrix protein 1 [Cocos nucifera]
MGLCFSRKESPSPPSDPVPKSIPKEKNVEEEKEKQRVAAAQPEAEAATEKKQVFVITQTSKKTAAVTAEEKDWKKAETPTKKSYKKEESSGSGVDRSPLGPVRASGCTKEEVDAILIQCGRLSRSSSGKASTENGGGHRRERSGSRERSNGGGRKGSRSPGRRSPGRRSEGPASSSSAGDKSKQPAKMVSVPAREKGGGLVTEAGGAGAKGVSSAAASKRGSEARGLRSASPRSRSPANTTRMANENAVHHNAQPSQPQSLSRSSSRKAEQSPYRRNPMAEIDENSLKGNQNGTGNYKAQKTREGEEGLRKPGQLQTQKASENIANLRKSEQRNGGAVEVSNGVKSTNVITSSVREQQMNCRVKEQQMEHELYWMLFIIGIMKFA